MAKAPLRTRQQHFNRVHRRITAICREADKAYSGGSEDIFILVLMSCAAWKGHRRIFFASTEGCKEIVNPEYMNCYPEHQAFIASKNRELKHTNPGVDELGVLEKQDILRVVYKQAAAGLVNSKGPLKFIDGKDAFLQANGAHTATQLHD